MMLMKKYNNRMDPKGNRVQWLKEQIEELGHMVNVKYLLMNDALFISGNTDSYTDLSNSSHGLNMKYSFLRLIV